MKIVPVTSIKNGQRQYNIQVNKSNNFAQEKQCSENSMFQLYFGRDIVKKSNNDFQKTVTKNFYHLKEGFYPDFFQLEAGKHLYNGKDVLAEAPTGIGKTAIAYYAASKNMADGKKTFYTTPLKALSNQKLNEFKEIFGAENVGILTGDRRENINAPIMIMTTEVYRNMALADSEKKENPIMENLGTVIFDEFHYLGDANRGPVWEESVMFTPKDVQLLALSATIGNSQDIKNWIGAIRGNNIELVSVAADNRPVPLKYSSIYTKAYNEEQKQILMKKIPKCKAAYQDIDTLKCCNKPVLSDYKTAIEKLNSLEQLPAIFFVFSRKSSENILDYLNSEGFDLTTKDEKQQITEILEKYQAEKYIGQNLNVSALKKGYAIHNAGIMPEQKAMIEEMFQKKLLKVVIATETLAAGINMPARTVVITSPYKPCDNEDNEHVLKMITANEYKQMSGRAGRRGIDEIGYVYTMPVDRTSQEAFTTLQLMGCNPIKSKYEPEYPFLCEYFDKHGTSKELDNIFAKSFFVNDGNVSENMKSEKMSQLKDLSERKIQLLEQTGYLETENGLIHSTTKGKMASKICGYDALTLIDIMTQTPVFMNLNPQTMALFAGAFANMDMYDEIPQELDCTKDISQSASEAVLNVYEKTSRYVNSMLKDMGKTPESFNSEEEVMKFINGLDVPDITTDEAEKRIQELQEIRSKLYKIKKSVNSVQFSINSAQELCNQIQKGETIPSKLLQCYLEELKRYKKEIKASDISSYIEKSEYKYEALKSASSSKKAKARNEKKNEEIKNEIKYAKLMNYLDAHLEDKIAENYQFEKKYPLEKVQNDYNQAQHIKAQITVKNNLADALYSLNEMKKYLEQNSTVLNKKDLENTMQEICANVPQKIFEINGKEDLLQIKSKPNELNRFSQKILYIWATLNKINPNSRLNWQQLLKSIPEDSCDEGTVFRIINQTADLLSQIKDAALTGMQEAENDWERKYYAYVNKTANEARELIIKDPII